MIDPGHPRLSIVRQCELAAISCSSFYRRPTAESEETHSSRRPGTARSRWRGICAGGDQDGSGADLPAPEDE